MVKTTKRENEIIPLLMEGYSNAALANHLGLTVNTVKIHLRNLYKKFEVGSRAQLVVKYRQEMDNIRGRNEVAIEMAFLIIGRTINARIAECTVDPHTLADALENLADALRGPHNLTGITSGLE